MPWFVGAWFAGVALFSFRLFTGWLKILSLRSRHNQAVDAAWLEKLQRLKQRLGVSRPVRMLQSWAVEVPTAIGWLCPVILLPASSLVGLTPWQIESILAHELAHIRRHDYLVNLLQCLAETLLFYHPAVWWVSKCIRAERENCCDDLAVQVCGDALGYAQALAALEELRSSPATLAMAANGKPLLQRIRRLLGQGTESKQTLLASNSGGILGILLVLALLITLPLAHSQKAPIVAQKQNTTSVTPNNIGFQANASSSPNSNLHVRTFNGDPNNMLSEINKRTASPDLQTNNSSSPNSNAAPALHTRTFKVDPNMMSLNITKLAGAKGMMTNDFSNTLWAVLKDQVFNVDAPDRRAFYNDRNGLLMVRATLLELDKVEKFLQKVNYVPPQLTFEVRFAEIIEQKDKPFSLGDVLKGQSFFQTTNASQFTNSNIILQGVGANATHYEDIKPLPGFNPGSLAIITDPQYRSVVKFFETQAGTDLMSAPKVTTLSGRQAQIKIVDIMRFPAENRGRNQKTCRCGRRGRSNG